jgi:D-alanyl-D-alanine carboxypeptidase
VIERSVRRTQCWPRFLAISLALLTLLTMAAPVSANEKYAAIVVDANTGETLFARHADSRRYPASLTKMMTLYVLFEELDAGRLTLDSRLSVSANAAGQAPSKLGVKPKSSIRVEDAILALVTKSANDVAVVVAENVGGSVSGFAGRMNRAAKALGMNATTFRNPHGLPDNGQYSSARDLARLGRALQDRFPSYYKYFSERSFTYKGARYRNHNRLLGNVKGVDGIKTGYIRSSGFNLVTSVRRDNRHIIAVVMGGKTASSRDAHMRELIAEYLPKASRGGRVDAPLLVADTGEGAALANVRTPRARPLEEVEAALSYAPAPQTRDLVADALAEAAAAPQGDISTGFDEELDPIAQRINDAVEAAGEVPLPAAAANDAVARLSQLARLRAGESEIIAGAAAIEHGSSQEGWHIQIGAVPTQEGAEALIEKARASMGPVLASLVPVTQPVEAKGSTLFRARFSGFPGKEEARATCAKLKSKSFSCLAVPN